MFSLIPKEVRFYDYFEQQSKHILNAAALLHDLCHNFSDARAKTHRIKEVEHAGDQVTHEIVKKLNTTFITPIDREDIHDLATRLDDAATAALADRLTREAGVTRLAGAEPGVELVRRGRYLFVLNRAQEPAKVPAQGLDLLTGARVGGTVVVEAGGAAVVREEES